MQVQSKFWVVVQETALECIICWTAAIELCERVKETEDALEKNITGIIPKDHADWLFNSF